MKAAWYEEYGAAADVFRLGELPDPAPGPGEVRVRLAWSGVNPSDCNRRRGLRDRPGYARIVPHNDGAGVIDQVGAGVDAARIGEAVWIWNAQRGRAFGTAAELIALPEAQAARMPDATPLQVGACLGVPAMTAYYSLFADGAIEGQDVLVTGGAGAVGHYAVQFARLGGARTVIATTSGGVKADIARQAGATLVLDYRRDDVAARIMEATEGRGVTRISEVDFGGNIAVIEAVAGYGCSVGAYASSAAPAPVLPFYPLLYRDVVLRMLQCNRMPLRLRAEATARVNAWCEAGALVHQVGTVLPLEEIAAAHELVERGSVVGNVLLRI